MLKADSQTLNAKDEGRGKMDEKKTNSIGNIERSERLLQGLFVVPLLGEAVFLLPSVFFNDPNHQN
jgi:hypothetical protein